jgi:DNA-binding CsgD family transcriptional regulator
VVGTSTASPHCFDVPTTSVTNWVDPRGTDMRSAQRERVDVAHDLVRLHVQVRNEMLGEALIAAAERHGWRHQRAFAPGTVRVVDRPLARPDGSPPGNLTVLVCEPTSFAARASLDAVSELLAVAVVCADAPADLVSALEGVRVGRVSVPTRVLDLAAHMPQLTERQLAVLSALIAGQTNAEIGRGQGLSPASVKRETSALYTALGAQNRAALAAAGRLLGVPARPALP